MKTTSRLLSVSRTTRSSAAPTLEAKEVRFLTRSACPGCEAAPSTVLYNQPFTENPIRDYLLKFYAAPGRVDLDALAGARYTLAECGSCGLIFQQEAPSDPLMKMIYDEWIDPEASLRKHQDNDDLTLRERYASEILTVLGLFGRRPTSVSVLDFGMGWGRWLGMAQAFGCRAYGLEFSPSRLQWARKNGLKTIAWDDLPQHEFDFINTEQVFEHLREPLETLRVLRDRLKPDGLIKISVPNGRRIKTALRNPVWTTEAGPSDALNPVSPLEHLNCFTYRSLRKMAAAAGLRPRPIPLRLTWRYNPYQSAGSSPLRGLLTALYLKATQLETYAYFQKA